MSQPTQIRVFDKSSIFRSVIIFGEMGKRSIYEAIWDSLTLNILLSHTNSHLWYVDKTSFWLCNSYCLEIVTFWQALLSTTSSITTGFVREENHTLTVSRRITTYKQAPETGEDIQKQGTVKINERNQWKPCFMFWINEIRLVGRSKEKRGDQYLEITYHQIGSHWVQMIKNK